VSAADPALPAAVGALIGVPVHRRGGVEVDGSVGDDVRALTGWPRDADRTGLPAATLSVWMRPATPEGAPPLALHHEVKDLLGLPRAVIARYGLELRRPVMAGELIAQTQRLTAVGPPERTRLGLGRRWEIEVHHTDDLGEPLGRERYVAVGYDPATAGESSGAPAAPRDPLPAAPPDFELDVTEDLIRSSSTACRDWAPVHHDPGAARRAGLPGLIMSTPALACWCERAVAGPAAVVVGIDLQMRRPVVARERLGAHVAGGPSDRDRVVSLQVDGVPRVVARMALR
jgi:acyl dehydratase